MTGVDVPLSRARLRNPRDDDPRDPDDCLSRFETSLKRLKCAKQRSFAIGVANGLDRPEANVRLAAFCWDRPQFGAQDIDAN